MLRAAQTHTDRQLVLSSEGSGTNEVRCTTEAGVQDDPGEHVQTMSCQARKRATPDEAWLEPEEGEARREPAKPANSRPRQDGRDLAVWTDLSKLRFACCLPAAAREN